MYERSHLQVLRALLSEPRRFLQVITGPRQVGKTTLVMQLTENSRIPYHFVSADAVAAADATWLIQQWQTARIKLNAGTLPECWLIIDEIQKLDNWSETVKKLWDEDTRNQLALKVLLLGSSRLMLQQGLTESLAGRFEVLYMGHWSFVEMRDAFGWTETQYAWYGGYPGSAALITEESRWKQYIQQSLVETCISKDILMLNRVDKPALLRRLFELGCLYSGQILSYTKMLGQFLDAGNTTTLAHYLDLLNTAGLLAGIEKYSGSVIKKRSSSPKFQVHNTALISSQRGETFEDIVKQPDQWGRIVESAIGAHLLNSSFTKGFALHYWREGNNEVDFVLEKNNRVIAIEVKSGASLGTKGMAAFQKQYQPDKLLLIGEEGLNWQEFLALDIEKLF